MRWQERIPGIENGNVDWTVLWVHNVEAANEFERNAAKVREVARTDPQRRDVYLRAYTYLLGHLPTTREWFWVTDTPFCTRAQLREYLQAFADYVFGDRPEPIPPPPNDEPCGHDLDEHGECVLSAAERAAEAAEGTAEGTAE